MALLLSAVMPTALFYGGAFQKSHHASTHSSSPVPENGGASNGARSSGTLPASFAYLLLENANVLHKMRCPTPRR